MRTRFTGATLIAATLFVVVMGLPEQTGSSQSAAAADSSQTSPESATPTKPKSDAAAVRKTPIRRYYDGFYFDPDKNERVEKKRDAPDATALRETLYADDDMVDFGFLIKSYDWEAADESLAAQAVFCLDSARDAQRRLLRFEAAKAATISPRPDDDAYEQKSWDEMVGLLQRQVTRGQASLIRLEYRCKEVVTVMGPATAPVLAFRRDWEGIRALGDKALPVLRRVVEDEKSHYRMAAFLAIREIFPDAKVKEPPPQERLKK